MSVSAFKVCLKTPFSLYSGYGHDGFELLRALHRWGADVYPQPVWLDVPIPGDLLPLFSKTLRAPFDLTICHWDPPHLEITRQARECTRLAVAWTMWEMTSLYPHCEGVDPLSEDDVRDWNRIWRAGWELEGKPAPPLPVKGRAGIAENLKWFDAVLGYSDVTMQALEPHIPEHVHRGVLQGGYEAAEWKYMERDWAGDRLMYVMHGALNRRKEPFLTLQAFLELCDEHPEFKEHARLAFHSTVPGVFPEMNEIYERSGIGVRVYLEAWDKPTLEQFYQAAHCYICPSHGEGKNIPALEFATTGGAVIVTDWSGHALALDTRLPTPAGWTTMGEAGVGSVLLDEQSRPCVVAAKSAVQYRDCYRVTFSDGTGVVASDEHRWRVQFGDHGQPWRVLTTRELWERKQRGSQQTFRLPELCQYAAPDRELPVHPYVLGLWLADGTSKEGRITVGSADVAEQVKLLQQYGEVSSETYVKTGLGEGWRISLRWLAHQLAEAGLHGPAGTKHIPAEYLRAGVQQRLELLQGLMDGDGCVIARGQCCFDNTNARLVTDVAELLRSLGIRVTGGQLKGADHRRYRLSFWTTEPVFRLERKRLRHQEYGQAHRRVNARTIRSVEPVPVVPTQCLTVDSPSHLYLCGDGWTPTHNTNWLSDDIGYPLACEVQPMFPGSPPDQAQWAVVSIAELKRAMWHVFTHREEAREKGLRASRLIPQMCSWDVVLENLFRRLRDLVPVQGEIVQSLAMSCRRDREVPDVHQRG